ncbi:MAG: MarR family transcriptional regulator [Lachnospiraceae bacterium]|nr:MarR family transcriptional regulator [Lachnospiraceae bacterium]
METDRKDLFRQLYSRAKILYNFTNLMNMHAKHTNCSTLAPELSMTEVHMLVDIMENPGIIVTELGRMNKKTRGAISQMTSKLERDEYLIKRTSDKHGKMLELYLTEKGERIADEHARYDVKALTATLNKLLDYCSMEEIDSFYKVLGCYNEILQEEMS